MMSEHVPYGTFQAFRRHVAVELIDADEVHVSEWQAMDVSQSKAHVTSELINFVFEWPIPGTLGSLQFQVEPDLPWAEDHFAERVGGLPLNPTPSHEYWPYHGKESKEKVYSHTYPERFWPTQFDRLGGWNNPAPAGIRFPLGDLDDVVRKLRDHKHTRQAWLPVWFPEDTWAMNHGQRVPCTIGYQFLIRDNLLYTNYYIRSCDFVRHFHNDVYLAARLGQWMVTHLIDVYPYLNPGNLTMFIASLHSFAGDRRKLQEIINAPRRSVA